jgi:hypothetical protein
MQYPIGITSTAPDGTVVIDFSQTAADDPNGHDWSRCILTYKIAQGFFLDPRSAVLAQTQVPTQQQPALSGPAHTGAAAPAAGAQVVRQLATQDPAAAAAPASAPAASAAARPAAQAGAAFVAGLAALAAALL